MNDANNPGPEVFFSDPQVVTLINAIDREDLAEINRLVAVGVNVNADGPHVQTPEKLHMTPLLWAINHKKKAAFQQLVQHGADPSQNVIGFAPCPVLSHAAGDEDADWLRMALERPRDLTLPTSPWGTTVLDAAINGRNVRNLDLLVKAGADVNYQADDGGTAAIAAAISSWFEGVYYLLEAGADYRPKTLPRGYDLAFFVIRSSVKPEDPEWAWREKVIDFLEKQDFDFGPAYQYVEKENPAAARRWREHMKRRAAEKERFRGEPK